MSRQMHRHGQDVHAQKARIRKQNRTMAAAEVKAPGSLFMEQLIADMAAAGQNADQKTKDDLKKRCSESVDHGDNRKMLMAMLTEEAKQQDPEFTDAVQKAIDAPDATFGTVADLVQQIVTKLQAQQAEATTKYRRDMDHQRDMFDAMTEMRRQTLESEGYDLTGSIYDRKTGDYARGW